MTQDTIGQRIKFLIELQQMSVRKFAQLLDISEANVRNYFDRGTKPSSDFFEKIHSNFPLVNLTWLISGAGQPLLEKSGAASEPEFNYTKNNYGNSVGSNRGGIVTQNPGAGAIAGEGPSEVALLRAMIKQLEGQLADKERTIQILLNHQPK